MHIDQNRLKTGLLLTGIIVFAILGQYYFHKRREYVWDAVIFIAIALICFVLLNRAQRSQHSPTARLSLTRFHRLRQGRLGGRPLIIGTACTLNLMAARSANTTPPPNGYTFSALLWLASLALLCAAFAPRRHLLRNAHQAIRDTRDAIRHNRRYAAEVALVLGLLLIGMSLRVWDLTHIPASFSGDEGNQGMAAVDVLEGRLRSPFATGWFTVPTMSFFAQAASLRLFGDSVAGLRTLSALIGTTTLVFTYLLARRGLGRRVALFALAALSFNHYHIHFSRLASNQIADPFFLALSLWLLTEGLRRTRDERKEATYSTHHWFVAAGLTIGLSWYGYFGSRVIVLIVAVYLATRAISEGGFLRRHTRALTLMILAALMAASPLLLYYTDFPKNLTARPNEVNFFRWLQNELDRPDHDSTFSLVLRQMWRSISAFNYTLDPTFWYRAQIPLLDFVSGILFVLGLAVAISQWRRPVVRLILIWFGLAITFGWMLTENPPSSMRMVIIAPAIALLVALGLHQLLTLARWAIGGHQEQWDWIGWAVLTLAAVLNVHYYFIVYTPTRVYGNPTAETATVLASYLRDSSITQPSAQPSRPSQVEDTEPSVYFYGPPFLYYDFGAISFIARDVRGVSVPPKDQDPGFQTRVLGPTLFVVLRERLDELAAIQERHPNGRLQEFYSDADGRLMFVIYDVPR